MMSMISPVEYLKEVIQELKKVSWPSRQETLNKTLLVIVVTTLLAVYVGGLDFLFQRLMATLIRN